MRNPEFGRGKSNEEKIRKATLAYVNGLSVNLFPDTNGEKTPDVELLIQNLRDVHYDTMTNENTVAELLEIIKNENSKQTETGTGNAWGYTLNIGMDLPGGKRIGFLNSYSFEELTIEVLDSMTIHESAELISLSADQRVKWELQPHLPLRETIR